jgi:PHD/YefM family antitoxin component YafN of YafNO toxin-antitoxin module
MLTMRKLKPEFLKKNGKTQFVVLTSEDYEAFQEMIEDARDVQLVREARKTNGNASGISVDEMRRRIGLTPSRKTRAS